MIQVVTGIFGSNLGDILVRVDSFDLGNLYVNFVLASIDSICKRSRLTGTGITGDVDSLLPVPISEFTIHEIGEEFVGIRNNVNALLSSGLFSKGDNGDGKQVLIGVDVTASYASRDQRL
jgi:hypothetical protein